MSSLKARTLSRINRSLKTKKPTMKKEIELPEQIGILPYDIKMASLDTLNVGTYESNQYAGYTT